MTFKPELLSVMLLFSAAALADSEQTLTYLGNEAVLFSDGDTKVLFDPLFNNAYGQYLLVTPATRAAIFEGQPPFDGVDAVFVSHYHDDHFDPGDMLRLLRQQPDIDLYAPGQAVEAMRRAAVMEDAPVFGRVNELDVERLDSPLTIERGNLMIEVASIPHSGWPDSHATIQNLTYRVTMGGDGTVLHLGDADPHAGHFEQHPDYWRGRRTDIAMPPFWFFFSDEGREILNDMINAAYSVGIHVPADFSNADNIPELLRNDDLFTEPGETRVINGGSRQDSDRPTKARD